LLLVIFVGFQICIRGIFKRLTNEPEPFFIFDFTGPDNRFRARIAPFFDDPATLGTIIPGRWIMGIDGIFDVWLLISDQKHPVCSHYRIGIFVFYRNKSIISCILDRCPARKSFGRFNTWFRFSLERSGLLHCRCWIWVRNGKGIFKKIGFIPEFNILRKTLYLSSRTKIHHFSISVSRQHFHVIFSAHSACSR